MKLSAAQIAAIESALAGVAAAAGGPVIGAAVTAAEGIANEFIPGALSPPSLPLAAPSPVSATVAARPSSEAVTVAASVSPSDFLALQKQMAEMAELLKAQQASVASALGTANAPSTHQDAVPGVGVQPVTVSPDAHPILVAAGRAPLVAQPVTEHDADLEDGATIPDIIDAFNALNHKVAALVEACGLGGSAAMAGHP